MTLDSDNFESSTPYHGTTQVSMGNGPKIPIKSIGTTSFRSPFDARVRLKLNKMLHVPNIKRNLISVSRFAKDNNVSFQFNDKTCFVILPGN